ncbi:ubiquinone biosynthesis O-methyltransferase, mitochondrial [Papilio machaon]|uniref:ubiquinone biosynthesis O-methyltransferase, mitochondrial n=1 Tax=Papilio machaon TaxID=76193 RepID=UPI001E663F42|nr:ubiquinone biosynthesis O-methyltransferase, mitochondrial [Papilio machaon]
MNLLQRKVLRTGLIANIQKCQLFGTTSTLQQNQAEAQAKSTIDSKDVHHHEGLMKTWWDELGPIKPLHSMNLVRVPFIRDGLVPCSPEERNAAPLRDKKILDVGCGGGILSEALAKIGASVTGIDAGKDLIDLATEHSKMNPKLANNLPSYICTSVEDHCKERKNYYDAVVASEVIEHVNNQELFLKSCIEAVKTGGKIFITTPNRSRATQFFGIFLAEYVFNLIPKGTHQYEKFLTVPELTFLLERNNCHVESTCGLIYRPLSNKWEFSTSQLIMFALQARKLE